MIVRILTEAENDLFESATWYEDRKEGLGDRSLTEFDRARRLILSRATNLPKVETDSVGRDIRRVPLRHFPFNAVVEILPNEVVILAVAHGRRKPQYWLDRT